MLKETTRPDAWILDIKSDLPDAKHNEIISPLHYGETIEIGLIRGIEGESYINGKRFEFAEKNVFFIPPKYLHTAIYRKGGSRKGDIIAAFHINMEALAPVIDIKKLLMRDGRTLFDIPIRCDGFDRIWELVQGVMNDSRSFTARLIDLISILDVIAKSKDGTETCAEYNVNAIKLVDWVEKNYQKKLSVQIAADHFGYNKHYFCKWVKTNTGTTFNEFLNAVRINHACAFLTNGYSVKETADLCGFSDISYIIKVFKRFKGVTPKASQQL